MEIYLTLMIKHTGNSTARAASAQVVDHGCVAFDNTINVEVAAITCVCDFCVFKISDSCLDGLRSAGTSPEEIHAHTGGPGGVSGGICAT